MTKLQTIKIGINNVHSNGDIFLSINDGQCYILCEKSGCERSIYVDENGRVYNENNKPCCTEPTLNTTQFLRLRQVERKLKELQDEINCIRNND